MSTNIRETFDKTEVVTLPKLRYGFQRGDKLEVVEMDDPRERIVNGFNELYGDETTFAKLID